MQHTILFEDTQYQPVQPFKTQLLKWVGNKQRFAHEIIGLFPKGFNMYYEPFLGSGAVMGTLSPRAGLGSDALKPLVEIWQTMQSSPQVVKRWYRERWESANGENKVEGYLAIRDNYNVNPNGADLLFLCRACYGGVVRFRQRDGYMSTPCGVHNPIKPKSFDARVDTWYQRIKGMQFAHLSFQKAFARAQSGDLIYCDPPYVHSQSILYRGQTFVFEELLKEIEAAKRRGVYVVLSIDGTKKSGTVNCDLPIPAGLFEREIYVNVGRSMLRRFQKKGAELVDENVKDRLLLTY